MAGRPESVTGKRCTMCLHLQGKGKEFHPKALWHWQLDNSNRLGKDSREQQLHSLGSKPGSTPLCSFTLCVKPHCVGKWSVCV